LFTERTNNQPLLNSTEELFDLPQQNQDSIKPKTGPKVTIAARAKPNPPRTRSQANSTGRQSRGTILRKNDRR
jgi:hypothetical protein